MNPALIVCLALFLLICAMLWHFAGHFQRHSRRITKLETELSAVPESLAQAHEYIRPLQQDTVRLWKEVHDLDTAILRHATSISLLSTDFKSRRKIYAQRRSRPSRSR